MYRVQIPRQTGSVQLSNTQAAPSGSGVGASCIAESECLLRDNVNQVYIGSHYVAGICLGMDGADAS